ncbi:MAG: CBS domain-containing protein [Candidatus Bathyarchaeia archaeon]|jgi:signal-transduction protein with cAMP-binding, CBS, and nucleotidyltransferase domain
MAEIGLRSKMLVKDIMSSPAVTVDENAPANKVAGLMAKHEYGCILVTTKQAKPMGIITERDLVVRVLAKNAKPDTVRAKSVMTSPLMTIESDATINDAARLMSKLNIRRLGVMYKGQLVGIVSSKDVLAVMPELLETIQEKAMLEGENMAEEAQKESAPPAGYCDHCGVWSDDLTEVNGEFLCEDCKVELETEE